ncbi:Uncharacterised protein [Streptococcus pneumoniae]|nr:Uncharacterised protein [Streptococcus pneumoniae]
MDFTFEKVQYDSVLLTIVSFSLQERMKGCWM